MLQLRRADSHDEEFAPRKDRRRSLPAGGRLRRARPRLLQSDPGFGRFSPHLFTEDPAGGAVRARVAEVQREGTASDRSRR